MYNFRYSMTFHEFQKIVNMAFKAKVPHIHICGTGEPFLNKHIIEMMDYLIKLYGYCSFQSNLNKNLMKKYLPEIIKRAKYISYITTDLHSSDPTSFSKIKKGSDYNQILDCLTQLSEKSEVKPLINISYILTKQNYKGIDKLINDLQQTKANFKLNINNLHAYNMNDFTQADNVYCEEDREITHELKRVQKYAKAVGASIKFPEPKNAEIKKTGCKIFWTRVQLPWPLNDIEESQKRGNALPGSCSACVYGNLRTIGNIFNYENFMDFWNNKILIGIRKNLIQSIYPDNACKICQHYIDK